MGSKRELTGSSSLRTRQQQQGSSKMLPKSPRGYGRGSPECRQAAGCRSAAACLHQQDTKEYLNQRGAYIGVLQESRKGLGFMGKWGR